ncbi:MAG TPA: R3H domain-containing nucleic acid-binding protein [Solirubrobacteraceae bacterium]|jgi:spoIIIJ-associated protein|nr:R3H domain-containing nucleic acid-binding protein [Solirubrobacteraceae bacterium]
MATDEDAETIEYVEEILDAIAAAVGVDAVVRVEDSGETILAEFVGDDLALLIGHHGQTIDAIQHLAYRIAYHGIDERKPVTVDAAGYRERRAAALHATADQAAEAAIREKRPVSLDPMGAQERKVVHEYLKSRFDVETYSEGQEPARRLVVAPLVG